MESLNFKLYGTGEPLLVLHGLFGTLDNWQTLGKKLADNYAVYLIDQRNHGRSPHIEGLDYKLMAADLSQFMEEHYLAKAHVLGHSMGGKTAMQFAFDHGDKVDKLIVVDIAPKAYKGGHEAILHAMRTLPIQTIETRKQADEHLHQAGIAQLGIRQFLLKNLTRDPKGGYRWKMNFSEIDNNYPNILANIEMTAPHQGETLFIRGDRSDYILPTDGDLIRSYFPKAHLVSIEKAGHWVHAEEPQALLEVMMEFLD
ncbi:MAG: alpha/beta fold hydrolase [Bacteroidota bacterium]